MKISWLVNSIAFKYRAAPEGAITRSQPDIREMEERRLCKETRQGRSMHIAVSQHQTLQSPAEIVDFIWEAVVLGAV